MTKSGKTIVTGLALLLVSVALLINSHATDIFLGDIHLNVLANQYGGVVFDHDLHVMVSEGCGTCHHHTAGTPVFDSYCASCHTGAEPAWTLSCRDCHTKDPITAGSMQQERSEFVFHDDVPNLKGAYHLSCLGCHQEMGLPVGCQDCHVRTEEGDRFFRSGNFAPGGAGSPR